MTKENQNESRTPVLDSLLAGINPAESAKTEERMALAARIDDLLQERGYSKKNFAQMLGKEPSVITKWLSGTHNFTTDTLSDICRVLNVRLYDLFAEKAEAVFFKSEFTVVQRHHGYVSMFDPKSYIGERHGGTYPIIQGSVASGTILLSENDDIKDWSGSIRVWNGTQSKRIATLHSRRPNKQEDNEENNHALKV